MVMSENGLKIFQKLYKLVLMKRNSNSYSLWQFPTAIIEFYKMWIELIHPGTAEDCDSEIAELLAYSVIPINQSRDAKRSAISVCEYEMRRLCRSLLYYYEKEHFEKLLSNVKLISKNNMSLDKDDFLKRVEDLKLSEDEIGYGLQIAGILQSYDLIDKRFLNCLFSEENRQYLPEVARNFMNEMVGIARLHTWLSYRGLLPQDEWEKAFVRGKLPSEIFKNLQNIEWEYGVQLNEKAFSRVMDLWRKKDTKPLARKNVENIYRNYTKQKVWWRRLLGRFGDSEPMARLRGWLDRSGEIDLVKGDNANAAKFELIHVILQVDFNSLDAIHDQLIQLAHTLFGNNCVTDTLLCRCLDRHGLLTAKNFETIINYPTEVRERLFELCCYLEDGDLLTDENFSVVMNCSVETRQQLIEQVSDLNKEGMFSVKWLAGSGPKFTNAKKFITKAKGKIKKDPASGIAMVKEKYNKLQSMRKVFGGYHAHSALIPKECPKLYSEMLSKIFRHVKTINPSKILPLNPAKIAEQLLTQKNDFNQVVAFFYQHPVFCHPDVVAAFEELERFDPGQIFCSSEIILSQKSLYQEIAHAIEERQTSPVTIETLVRQKIIPAISATLAKRRSSVLTRDQLFEIFNYMSKFSMHKRKNGKFTFSLNPAKMAGELLVYQEECTITGHIRYFCRHPIFCHLNVVTAFKELEQFDKKRSFYPEGIRKDAKSLYQAIAEKLISISKESMTVDELVNQGIVPVIKQKVREAEQLEQMAEQTMKNWQMKFVRMYESAAITDKKDEKFVDVPTLNPSLLGDLSEMEIPGHGKFDLRAIFNNHRIIVAFRQLEECYHTRVFPFEYVAQARNTLYGSIARLLIKHIPTSNNPINIIYPIVEAIDSMRMEATQVANQMEQRQREFREAPAHINSEQSVHTASVNRSVLDSIEQLRNRYYYIGINFAEIKNNLLEWISQPGKEATIPLIKLGAARRAIDRLVKTTDRVTGNNITIAQLLMLVWSAITDVNASVKREDAEQRFIDALYYIQRGYNLDSKDKDDGTPDRPICGSGTVTQLVTCISHTHLDIDIEFFSKQTIIAKLIRVTLAQVMLYLLETIQREPEEISLVNAIMDEGVSYIWQRIARQVAEAMYNEFADYLNSEKNTLFVRDEKCKEFDGYREFGEIISYGEYLPIEKNDRQRMQALLKLNASLCRLPDTLAQDEKLSEILHTLQQSGITENGWTQLRSIGELIQWPDSFSEREVRPVADSLLQHHWARCQLTQSVYALALKHLDDKALTHRVFKEGIKTVWPEITTQIVEMSRKNLHISFHPTLVKLIETPSTESILQRSYLLVLAESYLAETIEKQVRAFFDQNREQSVQAVIGKRIDGFWDEHIKSIAMEKVRDWIVSQTDALSEAEQYKLESQGEKIVWHVLVNRFLRETIQTFVDKPENEMWQNADARRYWDEQVKPKVMQIMRGQVCKYTAAFPSSYDKAFPEYIAQQGKRIFDQLLMARKAKTVNNSSCLFQSSPVADDAAVVEAEPSLRACAN